jgi:hypothetical protein
MADHDSLYRRLFDNPDMVSELLREFLAGPWLDDLDLGGMTRENATFHAVTGDRREGDMIWRIPRRDGGDTYLMRSGRSRRLAGAAVPAGKFA